MDDMVASEAMRIRNGHNFEVKKVEDLVARQLMKMITACKGKEGEEQAGIMSFYWMEIVTIVREAAAVGYLLGHTKGENYGRRGDKRGDGEAATGICETSL
jgi:hypothetical protein